MMKKWMAIFMMLLLACGAALAEETNSAQVSADGWTAAAKDGIVTVTDGEGNEIAALPYEKEEIEQEVLIAEDYNFDGRTDLAALTRMGTANGYFTVWLRTQDGGFEENQALSGLCAPTPNADRMLVESYERVSAAHYIEKAYYWKDGALELYGMRDVTYDTEADTVYVKDYTPVSDGLAVRERILRGAAWDRMATLDKQAAEIVDSMYGGFDANRRVNCEGTAELEGETYYVYSVEMNNETVGVMYFGEAEPMVILLDDVMDGMVNPLWQIQEDGTKAERG